MKQALGMYMKVKDSRLEDVIEYGLYEIRDNAGDYYIVCNLCAEEFDFMEDCLGHIINEHMEEELPDVLPYDKD
jgi:hypothetical protein